MSSDAERADGLPPLPMSRASSRLLSTTEKWDATTRREQVTDNLVTVEKIAEVIDDLIDVPPRTTRLLADEIHALLTGEGEA